MRCIYLLLLFFSFLLVGCDESQRQQTESVASPSLINSGLGKSGKISNKQALGTQLTTGGATTGFAQLTTRTPEGDLVVYGYSQEKYTMDYGFQFSEFTLRNTSNTAVPFLVRVPEPTAGGLTLIGSSLVMLLMLQRQRFQKSPESSDEKN